MMFRDQVGIVAGWFKGWNECEQTVALLSLLKRVTRTQARFLQLCLEHSLADCADIHLLEAEANSAAAISQWPQEPAEAAVALLLAHLPLLQPGNAAAKAEYMKRLQKVLAYAIESNRCVEESRQLLSYALIHPATTLDDRSALALWLGHLEERLAGTPQPPRPPPRPDAAPPPPRRAPHDWPEHGPPEIGPPWPEAAPRENGHPPFHPPSSGNGLGGTGDRLSAALPCQLHPSPLKRSLSLVPGSPQGGSGEWPGGGEEPGPPRTPFGDHAPLSPQSSVASSGSEQTEEPTGGRNTFQEDGSGMKDVPSWLKSLRLHKYAALFSQMTYEEMMTLTEHHLESQNVTKGARHKIALSIQKLRERQSVLKALEKDILEGGNLWTALQELQQIMVTPIKAFRPPPAPPANGAHDGAPPGAADAFAPHPAADTEAPAAPVPDGDIPGQFTRVMGKVCTQLLVSRPDEENITSYLQLLEKCLSHEAFTETQKKRLLSWKQQVLKLLRAFPKKVPLDGQGYRPPKGWGFGSNSLPIAGSVGGAGGRRGQRPFALPPRALPPARMGLLGPAGGGPAPRPPLGATPLGAQGRQSLWFSSGGAGGAPGSRSVVQRTHSLPVHTSPQALLAFPQECPVPGTDLEINPTLESLCLSMTEHALGDGADKTSTI
ncbi:LOW QUALITY PROTEIN: protein Smaug homolog 2 isoform X1 [Gallus gallus]|nr:LOW QUALITY PROTEIN: protein Smaug homolog 2 isoform X1 [Gallus gallus]